MAGYEILQDNSKKNNILMEEGVCPCCGHYPSVYSEQKNEQGKITYRQFKYRCRVCESIWVGNIYDNNLNIVGSNKKAKFISKIRRVCNAR